MKKRSFILSLAAIIMFSFNTQSPAGWTLDPLHSSLRFSLSSLMISDVEGSFKIKEASITGEKDDFSDAVVHLIADVNTIDTDVDERDTHLKSPDFFDAQKYPHIVFKSTKFEKAGDNRYNVTGDLSFHGITRQVTLDAVANYGIHPMSKKSLVGFRVKGIIKRTDFGIAPTTPTDMLGDEVNIAANTQFAKN